MLLKELCELNGVSGNEQAVRDYIRERIREKVNTCQIDRIGNLLAEKNSDNQEQLKILLCAHMDEIGLFITEITSDGYLKFQPVGGIDSRILPAKTVTVGDRGICGVIGCKAVHLTKKEERKKALNIEDLYIDIGANSKEEAEKDIRLGDYAVLNSTFAEIGKDFYKAKALDDRVGCALLMEILDYSFACDLIAAFTVQEEVGLRGSKVVSNYLQADLAIVVEATRAQDYLETEPEEWIVEPGKGPACSLMDSATIYRPELIQRVAELATEHNIPLQFRQSTAAGNDAGNIHKAGGGIPTITLSIPCRNIHTMSSLISKQDYINCFKLLTVLLNDASALIARK